MSTTIATAPTTTPAAVPQVRFDWIPLGLVAVLALIALPLIGSPSTWLTLTVAGLAMGMIVFITASGLTLVFGLMDVLNFGHGVFIALGAFVATTVLLVEQNFNMARALGDTVAVMDDGRVVHRGAMAELAADEGLQQRLLGLSLGAHQ